MEEELADLKDLRQAAIDFIDNGASELWITVIFARKRSPESSDNPEKAVISVQNDRLTSIKCISRSK
ncbi:MAG: hypothetical protein R2776_01285 [Flavobacteriaceae bacterium]